MNWLLAIGRSAEHPDVSGLNVSFENPTKFQDPFTTMQTCDYCGYENADEAANCAGCGNPFGPEPIPPAPTIRKKSKAVAVILALIFGPIGLFYLGGEGLMLLLFILGLSFLLLPLLMATSQHMNGFGVLISLVGRAASAWWAIVAVDRRNSSPDLADARVLLNEAAKFENIDFAQAIAKYEEIIARFPDTAAAESAKICLQTLKTNNANQNEKLS